MKSLLSISLAAPLLCLCYCGCSSSESAATSDTPTQGSQNDRLAQTPPARNAKRPSTNGAADAPAKGTTGREDVPSGDMENPANRFAGNRDREAAKPPGDLSQNRDATDPPDADEPEVASNPMMMAAFPSSMGKVGLNKGDLIPEITGTDLEGTEFKLSDYQGKVIMLDFWGDW